MKVIVRVSHGEYTEGVDYALIEICADDAKRILDARRALKELQARGGPFADLRAFVFTDYSPRFFDYARLGDEGERESDEAAGIEKDLLTQEQRAELEDQTFIVVPDDFTLYERDDEVETAGEQLVVREDDFGWTAYIEHSGEQIETWSQSYQLLNRLL